MRVERLAAGGDGVGRLADGLAVFVPLTAPGDQVEVRVIDRRKRFARAEIVRVVEPGPERREPACEVFGRCGGCAWQHIEYGAQLAAKRAILVDALERIGAQDLGGLERAGHGLDFVASPDEYRYRGRARLLVAGGKLGYRERRSHRLCPVSRCPVLAAALEAKLQSLAVETASARPASRTTPADVRPQEWELQLGRDGMARASRLTEPAPQLLTEPHTQTRLPVGGDEIVVSSGTFAQANVLLLDTLRSAVVSAAGAGKRALELHCGAGFFTLALAARFGALRAVESSPGALADLRRNLAAAGAAHVEVIEGRAEETLLRELEADAPLVPDVVVLDPPRSGLAPGGAASLGALGARRIVYLSCDPATLARDVRTLCLHGYRLTSVCGFDLFPQTPHVEALVTLELGAAG